MTGCTFPHCPRTVRNESWTLFLPHCAHVLMSQWEHHAEWSLQEETMCSMKPYAPGSKGWLWVLYTVGALLQVSWTSGKGTPTHWDYSMDNRVHLDDVLTCSDKREVPDNCSSLDNLRGEVGLLWLLCLFWEAKKGNWPREMYTTDNSMILHLPQYVPLTIIFPGHCWANCRLLLSRDKMKTPRLSGAR